jgi:type VI secretion system protein ImpC
MTEGVSIAAIDAIIAQIDAQVAAVVDDVLHHPTFQSLEASWRGLAYVVDRVAFDQNVQVAFLDFPEHALRQDLSDAADVTRTMLFRLVYTSEYGQFGGEPYGALFLDLAVTASAADVAFLRKLAAIAAMAHAPACVAAHPSLLQLSSFSELSRTTDLAATFEGPSRIAWNAFRETEDSRYVGVFLPRVLLRLPHRDASRARQLFPYEETVTRTSDMLWGSAVFGFAVRLAGSFATHRSYLGTLDGVGDEPPVVDVHDALRGEWPKPAVDVILSSRLEQKLSEVGLVPLGYDPLRGRIRFARAPSLQRPKSFGGTDDAAELTTSFLLGTRLPYIFLASRFAHYLKVIERERIGQALSRTDVEKELNNWLKQFVVALDGAPAATRLKYPLRAARVRLFEVDGDAGWYRMSVHLQPHVKYLAHAVTLSVEGRVEAR